MPNERDILEDRIRLEYRIRAVEQAIDETKEDLDEAKARLEKLDKGEDLEKFRVNAGGVNDGLYAEITPSGKYIKIGITKMGVEHRDWFFTIDKTTEIYQKLGQLLAEAKRRKKQ